MSEFEKKDRHTQLREVQYGTGGEAVAPPAIMKSLALGCSRDITLTLSGGAALGPSQPSKGQRLVKVLVTGGTGVIGSWVVRRLLEEGLRPFAFDQGLDAQLLKDVADRVI